MGFRLDRGMSRSYGRMQIPVIKELLTTIRDPITRYGKHAPADIWDDRDLASEAEEIFNRLGPKLWPDPDLQGDRSHWLVDAGAAEYNGVCERDYYFSNREDREM